VLVLLLDLEAELFVELDAFGYALDGEHGDEAGEFHGEAPEEVWKGNGEFFCPQMSQMIADEEIGFREFGGNRFAACESIQFANI
jgi:hypothetical protein